MAVVAARSAMRASSNRESGQFGTTDVYTSTFQANPGHLQCLSMVSSVITPEGPVPAANYTLSLLFVNFTPLDSRNQRRWCFKSPPSHYRCRDQGHRLSSCSYMLLRALPDARAATTPLQTLLPQTNMRTSQNDTRQQNEPAGTLKRPLANAPMHPGELQGKYSFSTNTSSDCARCL